MNKARWYTVCYPAVDIAASIATAMMIGTMATNRKDAWDKFRRKLRPGETKTQLQKTGFRVRCVHLSFEVAE